MRPQTPPELLVILAAIADERIPIQTIAPKFTGRFNKGVDYVGDVVQFEKEFSEDLAVIAFAIRQYGLPANLKLSVHSGSDKFSIYAPIRRALRKFDAGVHLKTAGTTWLEELIGLAEAGGEGLDLAKQIYAKAFENRDALCAPYATVIDIDYARLPAPATVNGWSSGQYTSALRHDQTNPGFNPDLRQLLHVGFKVAAKMGDKYLKMLDACEASHLPQRHRKSLRAPHQTAVPGGVKMRSRKGSLFLAAFGLALAARAQDTRVVTEPVIPPTCAVLTAKLAAIDGNKTLADADEAKLDTGRIQKAMDACPKGQAVVLKAGGALNAFLTGPLDLQARRDAGGRCQSHPVRLARRQGLRSEPRQLRHRVAGRPRLHAP